MASLITLACLCAGTILGSELVKESDYRSRIPDCESINP
jgi:hypothetical protein